jgi:hypothetical protein
MQVNFINKNEFEPKSSSGIRQIISILFFAISCLAAAGYFLKDELFSISQTVTAKLEEAKVPKVSTAVIPEKPLVTKSMVNELATVSKLKPKAQDVILTKVTLLPDPTQSTIGLAQSLKFLEKQSIDGVRYGQILLRSPGFLFASLVVDSLSAWNEFESNIKRGVSRYDAHELTAIGTSKRVYQVGFHGWYKKRKPLLREPLGVNRLAKVANVIRAYGQKSFGKLPVRMEQINSVSLKGVRTDRYRLELSLNKIEKLSQFLKIISKKREVFGVQQVSLNAIGEDQMRVIVELIAIGKE